MIVNERIDRHDGDIGVFLSGINGSSPLSKGYWSII
jgi:hypothetical protein